MLSLYLIGNNARSANPRSCSRRVANSDERTNVKTAEDSRTPGLVVGVARTPRKHLGVRLPSATFVATFSRLRASASRCIAELGYAHTDPILFPERFSATTVAIALSNNSEESKNGDPGRFQPCHCPMNAANVRVNKTGPSIPEIPRRLLIAPWSCPCSEGLTRRHIIPWAAGPEMPQIDINGIPNQNIHPNAAKP